MYILLLSGLVLHRDPFFQHLDPAARWSAPLIFLVLLAISYITYHKMPQKASV